MEKYRVTFKKSVAIDLRRIPGKEMKRILQRNDALAVNPTSVTVPTDRSNNGVP